MKKLFTFAGLAVLAVTLALVTGSAASVASYLDDVSPIVRLAASSVVSQQCNDGAIGASYSRNGIFGANTTEGRLAGFQCEVKAMVSGPSDPFIGATATAAANAQKYANLSVKAKAPSVSRERRYARAEAAVTGILTGFAIVPGGPAEAFNRIQTCLLDSNMVTNQGNKAAGVSLDCSEPAIRSAIANRVATGFYEQFGKLVNFGCTEYLAQAQGGTTVEARWAAAKAYVAKCSPNLDALISDTANLELAAAAISPAVTAGGTSGTGDFADIANYLAAGVNAESSLTLLPDGNPSTTLTGNLFKFATKNFGTTKSYEALCPLARFFYGPVGQLNVIILIVDDGTYLVISVQC